MKQIIIALLMGATTIQSLKLNNLNGQGTNIGVRFLLQQQNQGIFDKVIGKINKEQADKEEAVAMVLQQKEDGERAQELAKFHAKHEAEAQQQAMALIGQLQEEAKLDASTMLHEAVTNNKQQEKQPEEDEIQEQQGFLGSFNQKIELVNQKKNIEQEDKEVQNLNLHSKIDSEFAPKMAKTAVGQVLNDIGFEFAQAHPSKVVKEVKAPVPQKPLSKMSQDQKKLMKQHLASKLAESKVPEGTQKSTLAKFDALPTIPATTEECDAIGTFLQKANEQEKNEREKAAQTEGMSDAAIKTAHHSYAESSKEQTAAQVEEDIENPFASVYALQHPEILQQAQEHEYNMHSFYSE